MHSANLKKVINQVPPDYYSSGVKSNIFQKYWHNKKWGRLENLFNNYKKAQLLDIGCADGTTTFQIYKKYPDFKIVGLDYYDKAIKYAKKSKPQIQFVVADAHKLPFQKKSFDIVTIIETLEHLTDPNLALNEIYRVLKPQGLLIIIQDTDSILFKSIWWLWNKWKGSVWKNSHISCITPKKLMKNVRQTGFKINKIEYINLKMEILIKAQKK